MTRRLTLVLAVVAATMMATTAAWAAWAVTSANARGAGKATAIPAAAAPSVSASGTTVTVSWSAVNLTGGPAVTGYTVRAYNASTNAPRAVGGTCTGTVSALTCNDTAVAGGGWKYTVQAKQGAWSGAESAKSATVTVVADTTPPVTTDNSSTIGAGPHNVTKTVTLSPTDAGGSGVAATYYTTNGSTPTTSSPQGTSVVLATDGVYTIKYFSVDGVGNTEAVKTASTVITIDKTAPTPSALTLVNTGTAGTAAQGDRVDITLSETLAVASMCSTWSGNASNQSLAGNGDVVVTITNSGTNDVLTVSSGTCTFNLGSIALGGDYVTATTTFSGNGSNKSSISWTVSTKVLSITLGNASAATRTGVAAGTPVWTPSTSITDVAGNAMAATAFTGTSSRF